MEFKVTLILLAFIALLLIWINNVWCYLTIKSTYEEKLKITKILAMSKDGFEPEISKVQSKRNLFKFIKTYMTKETNFVAHPEEFWWKKRVMYRKQEIEESYRQFLTSAAPIQEQEDFAYEGIFDEKNKKGKSPTKMNRSRIDISDIFGNLNRSKIEDDNK